MCGIAGYAGRLYSLEERRHYLQLSCEALKHRGPDDTGYLIDARVALGATRLAIRDPLGGTQPMTRCGYSLVFNGEIYALEPLKNQLQNKGYLFSTQSDTEVFLHAFIEFGPDILREMAGMFAFALWDNHQQTLYLGRDRWGEKPLYYSSVNEDLIFASEIKGLTVWPQPRREIDLNHIRTFLKNSYIGTPHTGWKGIFKLEPGSLLTWKEGQHQIQRYISPQRTKKDTDLFITLKESVRACAVSDRPVGVFLSGGLDSSTVACLLSQEIGSFPVFSIEWEEAAYSEKDYAAEVARHLNLPHTSVECTAQFFQDNFEKIADLYDEPFADESMFPTFCLAQEAKKQVDVVLTGDGADEFFHGYERYFYEGPPETYLDVFSATPDAVLQAILSQEFMPRPYPKMDDLRMRSLHDISTYLPDDILTKVDRATMAVGLEARAPFLMPAITNFALSCSLEELSCKPMEGKSILREAMRRHLPERVLQRKKMGFGMPLKSWFASILKEWVRSHLLEGPLIQTGWFSRKGIENLAENPIHSRTILNLAVLNRWLSHK